MTVTASSLRPNSADFYRRAQELEDAPFDTTAIQRLQKERGDVSSRAMMLALAAHNAGPEFDMMQRYQLGRVADANEPMKLTGGVMSPSGEFIADPLHGRDRRIAGLERQGAVQAGIEQRADAEAQRAADRAETREYRERNDAAQRAFERALLDRKLGAQAARAEAAANRPGRPDLVAQRAAAQRLTDANDALALLSQADPLIDKATSSGAGAVYDKTAGFFGKSTSGGDAAAQLSALGGALVAKMPKMSGPQSDKDVQLYKEMAGRIGDPGVPASQKRAAMQTIGEIQRRYLGIDEGQPGSTGGASGSWDDAPAGAWSAVKRSR